MNKPTNTSQPMLHYKAVAGNRFRKGCDIALGVFGAIVMVYTTGQTIVNWASSGAEAPSVGYCDGKMP